MEDNALIQMENLLVRGLRSSVLPGEITKNVQVTKMKIKVIPEYNCMQVAVWN
jgi:hypothetical protein